MRKIKDFIHRLLFQVKVWVLYFRKKRLEKSIFRKERITVVFFVLYDNMWKNDGLFEFLLKDSRFAPYIVSSPYPHHPRIFSEENQKRVECFFKKKGYPYFNGYDFADDKWFDIKGLEPDIVFYQQPYNTGYKGFLIESLCRNTIFGYIPYCYTLEDDPHMYNTLLFNIAWKVFLPSEFEKNTIKDFLLTNGRNLVVTGHSLADELIKQGGTESIPWKDKTHTLKRVIWAPHHSILDEDSLNYSNFLVIAEDMLKLVTCYEDRIEFAFKPHPVLKRKLYNHKNWGVEKTDQYYQRLANAKNSIYVEGDYATLFRTSDAMIHDCSTFTAEYLYTKNPTMFVSKQNRRDCFNDFGHKCLEQHYIGHSIEDIISFLNDVVLKGDDYMKNGREKFFKEYLLPPSGERSSYNMYKEFVTEI